MNKKKKLDIDIGRPIETATKVLNIFTISTFRQIITVFFLICVVREFIISSGIRK